MDDLEDLVHLLSLETDDIVDTLRRRFSNKRPYILCGSVCISTNPHEHLPHLYAKSEQCHYAAGEAGVAHPYILVNRALEGIVAPHSASSHTLVVTGESGSGKTEMAKICLGFACGRAADPGTRERLQRILTTGQILEYAGNAQTTRNGNSSRFGKFLQVFYREGSQVGAAIQTYLLERGRIVHSSQQEGTFRIVYAVIDHFCNEYALQGLDRTVLGSPTAAVPSTWEWFEQACEQTGLTSGRVRTEIVDPIVAILFLLVRDYANASAFLGVETSALTQAIHNRRTTVNGEILWSECSVDETRHRCKALAMSLYQRLFARVVQSLNEFIGCAQVATTTTSLNILDIFGFESLETNGLEQLCINYCNERIQALFLTDAIVAQRAEYQQQGIDVDDSADLLQRDEPDISLLCETGLFPMLDEANRMPNSTAMDFVDAIRSRSFDGVHVPMVRRQDSAVFSVDHYAGTIEYTADAFVERNTDELREEILDVLRGSSRADIKSLCQAATPPPSGESFRRTRGRMWTVSVTRAFSNQMIELLDTIRTTTAHYIRCIRPNKTASTDRFDEDYVREQIRANGIVQAAHVMRKGYAHRTTHEAFSNRFPRMGERAKCDGAGLHWGTTLVYLTEERYMRLRRDEAACAIQRTYARYDASRRKLIVVIRKRLRLQRDVRVRRLERTMARASAAARVIASERAAANAEGRLVALQQVRRRVAVRAIEIAVKARNARIFDRWKELDEIGRLKAHVAVLRAEIRLKDAWIFQAQQQMRASLLPF